MADAAEPGRARLDVRLEHRRHFRAQREVGGAHNPGRGAHLPKLAAGALRRDAAHELRLADRLELLGAIRAVHRLALDEDRLSDVVPGRVGYELIEQVSRATHVPKVMVRVDDRQLRFHRRLVHARQPIVDSRHVVLLAIYGWLRREPTAPPTSPQCNITAA